MNTSPYNASFYRNQMEGSEQSARAVIPVLLSILKPASVVDVGCGVGTWLRQFIEQEIPDVLGIDGVHVDRRLLRIPPEKFIMADLSQPLSVRRRFDLALCLGVAEHLPETRAAGLVADLASLAPVVLFSAAIPGQGGTSHVNEQWPEYWQGLFAQWDYCCLDCLRPLIWNDDTIEPWYRQNLLIYARSDHPVACCKAGYPLSIVHPAMFAGRVPPSIRHLLPALIQAVWKKLGRRNSTPRTAVPRCRADGDNPRFESTPHEANPGVSRGATNE